MKISRRELFSRILKSLVCGGFLAIAWRFLKGTGPGVRRVAFKELPGPGEVSYREGVYLMGFEKKVLAFHESCPHLGCRLEFRPDLNRFRCPCHGSEFSSDGRRLRGPARRDMTPLEMKPAGRDGECLITVRVT